MMPDKNIKVIIFQKYITPYRVNLFNALSENKNINLLLAYYGKYEKTRKWTEFPDAKFPEYKCRVLSLKINYEKNLNIPFVFSKYLFNYKPDAVICFADAAGFFLLLWKLLLGIKIIVWSESTKDTEENIGYIKKKWRQLFFSNADCFILPGAKSVEYIKDFNNTAEYFIAPNSVDDSFEISESDLSGKFTNPEKIIFIYAGNLTKTKGIDILLNALNMLSKEKLKREYEVIILGEGTEEKREIKNVTYLGFKQVSEYSVYLKKSHVTIIPSRKDRNPLIMIEAIKSGNIIICSKFAGNHPEAVDTNGIILEELNAESILKSMVEIINLPDNRLFEMAERSLEKSKSFNHKLSSEAFFRAIEYTSGKNKTNKS
jgi:glycosyltransferase involved in cell wall biosynthesis